MKQLFHLILFSCFTLFLFWSCGGDDRCRTDSYVRMEVYFYTVKTDTVFDEDDRPIAFNSKIVKLTVDSISIKGVGTDSLLYNNTYRKDSVRLPLNKLSEEANFVFNFNNEETDTVSFFYENKEEYLSFECGILNSYILKDSILTTNNYIDSIRIKTYDVNTSNAENIQIYHTPK